MSEFVFKNLTVKLMPEAETPGDVPTPDCAACSAFVSCGVPSINCGFCSVAVSCRVPSLNCGICSVAVSCKCTNLVSVVCDACSRFVSCPGCSLVITDPCWRGTVVCPGGTIVCPGGTIDCGITRDPCGGSWIDPIDIGDIRKELGQLKTQLRLQLQQVEQQEAQLAEASKPKTVEEIDRLKEQLLNAVAELDEQRKQMQQDDTDRDA